MDRNREARRLTVAAATNGLSRRRHRAGNLRYSPEEDAPFESPETARLRDRGASLKKERDRERDREREREKDRDRLRSKRRRGERLMMHGNRDDGGDDSSQESINVDEEEADGDGGGGPLFSSKMLPPSNSTPPSFSSSSLANHQNSSGSLQHRKSFPPPAKVIRTTVTSPVASPVVSTWKPADEMIGVSVPRKARSASTKRSHEPWSSGASGVVFTSSEQIHRQKSTSPARGTPASMLTPTSPPAPTSPSSSSASVRKKMKPMGQKQRPPKSTSSKPSSSPVENEIEIEIAEVLYGMMRQPSVPSKEETTGNDSTTLDNKSISETKSKVSSPISNSQYPVPQSNPANSSSSNPPVSAIAPKRKRPRPVKYEEEKHNAILPSRCSSMSSTTKPEIEISAKLEAPNKEDKISGSKVENHSGLESSGHAALPSQLETEKREVIPTFDLKPLVEESEKRDANPSSNNELSSLMKLDDNVVQRTAIKVTLSAPEKEKQREESFKIDLMAPARSPEREYGVNRVAADPKTKSMDVETEAGSFFKKIEKTEKSSRKEDLNSENQEEKLKVILEVGSQKQERNIDLKFDLEKCDREDGSTAGNGNKPNHLLQKQPQQQQPNTEKTAQASALPLHMSIPGWPGGLPPMGYMAPLQGVVSMDGSSLSSAQMQPPHMLFNQPRPKRCATHCYIARNIHYHQQFTKMNPFWPAAAGSPPIYGAKPCNLSLMPPSEIQANASGQVSNSSLDRSSHLASSSADNAAQRKQILIQAGLPPVAASNMMHGPTFIFPLSQQPQATSSVRPAMSGSTASGTCATSSASTSGSAAATPVGATTMSFSYPNMPGNETQYLAFLQNNAYPFPVPAHVGAPPGYRGGPGQTMPFFNGQFYPSQMLHPSHLQPQQQQLPLSQAQQNQKQGNQNLGNTAAPSAAQKQLQNQQQRPGNSSGTLQGFPAQKNQSQPLNFQQRQNSHQQSEIAGDDSPSTTDNRVSRFNVTYGQNLMLPMQTSNFGISGSSVPNCGNNSHVEKKAQQQSSKASVEPFTPQPFAMSFSTINGVTAPPPGLDMSSAVQNHAMFQSLPEAARQGYKMMAAAVAAQAAQQKINFRAFDDGKHEPNNGSNASEDRKSSEKTTTTNTGQSIAFSRHDMSNATAVTANNVIDSSARLLNLGSAPPRASNGSSMPPAHVQMLRNQQQQQQQILQLQKQQQYAAAAAAASAARSKVPVTSNGTVFPDHNVPSSSLAAVKLPNKLSGLSRNIVQTSGGHGQSPQWKNNHSSRTSTSQVSSPSMSPSMSSSPNPSMKNVTQKVQIRSQQAQISFAANPKSSSGQVQQAPNSNQSPSPPVLGGSPSTSSVSKSAGGSPRRAASTSTGNKPSQASSTLPSQPARNSPSSQAPNQSQSGGRIVVPSVHGNPTALGTGTKPQLSHQQPQQPPKHALQQAQLFFSGAYMQPQQQHSSSNINISPASGYYLQRHQQQTGLSTTSSPLTMCSPATVSNTNSGTCDPAKAIAGAANNQKQGATQTAGKTHQLVPPGFPYVHAVPTTVQAKPADQKQAGGE